MESTLLGGSGTFAAWVKLLGRQLALLIVLSLSWAASPANADPDPMDISYTISPGGTLDEDSDISIEVTPSISTTYSGYLQLDVALVGEAPATQGVEVDSTVPNSIPVRFEIGKLPAGNYHAEILFYEDGAMFPNSRGFDFTVEGDEPPFEPVLSPSGDRSDEEGTAVNVTFSVTNDTDAYTFSADNLPSGLSIDPSTGQVTGSPNSANTFNVTITATSGSKVGTVSFNWSITEAPPPLVPVLSPTGDRSTEQGTAVNVTFSVTNDIDAYTFSADNLPNGLSIDPNTGQVTGTPGTADEFEVTITVEAGDKVGALTFTWTITEPPPLVPVLSPTGDRSNVKGTAIAAVTFSVTNDSLSTYTFSAANLPAGLSIDTSTGSVTGTPTTASTPTVTITATSGSKIGSITFKWSITEPSTPPPPPKSATAIKLSVNSVYAGKKPTFKATVTAANDKKPSGKLKVTITGPKKYKKTFTMTVTNGKASYASLKLTVAGSYQMTSAFTPKSGTPYKSSTTKSKKFTVKKPKKKSAAMTAPVGIAAPLPNPTADAVTEAQLGVLGDTASLLLEIGSENITSTSVENAFAFGPDQVELSTSLSAINEAAGNQKRGAIDIWMKGSFGFLNTTAARATSSAVTLGADYMFSPEFIGGIGLSLDRQVADQIGGPGTASGLGWLIAPYLKGRIADVIGYGVTIGGGGVGNELSPDGTYTDTVTGTRLLAAATVNGDIPLSSEWTLSPSLTASYVEQHMNAYTSGGGGTVAATANGLAKLAIAPSLERTFLLSDDGTTVTIGGNLELALEAANQNGVFATPYWRVGAGLDLALKLGGGATLRGGLDASQTQGGSNSLRGTVGLSATIN